MCFRGWVPTPEERALHEDAAGRREREQIWASTWQSGRPWSASIKAATTLVGCGIVLGGPTGLLAHGGLVAAVTGSVWLHGFATYCLDDYWDREPDKTNHPERPIPRGAISPTNARRVGVALFVASTALAGATGSAECVAFMAANNVAFACYTPLCRYSKIAANASIVYWNVMPWAVVPVALAGVADLAGGSGTAAAGISAALWPALFMVPTTIAREIVFDWKDQKGDAEAGLRTIATVYGKSAVFRVANASLAVWAGCTAYLAAGKMLGLGLADAGSGAEAVVASIDLADNWLFIGWNAAHVTIFAYFLERYRASGAATDYRTWRNVATSLKSANVAAVGAACLTAL